MSRITHCNMAGLLQIDNITSPPTDRFFTCAASILSVDCTYISIAVTYYNDKSEQFANGAIAFFSGPLMVAESSATEPRLCIRPNLLITYVIIITFPINVTNF